MIGYKVSASITLYKRYTDGVIDIDKVLSGEFEEQSEEYIKLCSEKETDIGYLREDDPDRFDKEMLEFMSETARSNILGGINTIKDIFSECMLKDVKGKCEFFGTIFNPKDFCAMEVHEIKTNCYKK